MNYTGPLSWVDVYNLWLSANQNKEWHLTTTLDFFDHWQSLLSGVAAIGAGFLAYFAGQQQAAATLKASANQLSQSKETDLLRAQCIAYAIVPEMARLRVCLDSSKKIIELMMSENCNIRSTFLDRLDEIFLPDLDMVRVFITEIFLMDDVGKSLAQLFAVLNQYNSLVKIIKLKAENDFDSIDGKALVDNLKGHIETVELNLIDIDANIGRFHH
jgi:hypothetical protein